MFRTLRLLRFFRWIKRLFGALAAAILVFGCSSPVSELKYDAVHPIFRVTNRGLVFDGNKYVKATDAAAILEKHSIPKDATIHVKVDPDFTDNHKLWVFQHEVLNRAGYKHVIFVHDRYSGAVKAPPRNAPDKRGGMMR